MKTPIHGMLAGLVTLGVLGVPAGAAEPWTFVVEPYIMLPNMSGSVAIANLPPAHIDEGPSDIFSNLQWGAMLYLEARNELWAFSSDLLYMDLKADGEPGDAAAAKIKAEAEQLGWELAVLRRISPMFELGLAATYNEIKSGITVTPAGSPALPRISLTQSWVDPSVVLRAEVPLRGKWSLVGRGNIGGFGIGSDLFWQIQAHTTYELSGRMNMSFGYRFISVDYDHGSGPHRFVYDVNSFGPVFRFAWVL